MNLSLRLLYLTVVVALAAAGCALEDSGGQDRPTTAVTSQGEHADGRGHGHGHGHDVRDSDGDVAEPATGTTAETIAAMRTLDAERVAPAHDHHDVGEVDSPHPNGVVPTRIVIPAIDVDADVIELGLQEDGTMDVPADFAQTGWFRHGPPPGRVGPAVIAGHVDSRSGPAVFHRLTDLAVGDHIQVHGADGDVVTFAVRDTEQHAKDAFPTERVYAGTPGPELRLITCGGDFDRSARSYRDNLIVYADRIDA